MPTWNQVAVASVTRRYPLLSGCASIANSPWLMKVAPPNGSERVWAAVPGGEVYVSLDDFVGRSAYFFGDLDPKLTWICKRLVGRGDTVLDIGANLGVMTTLLSRLVGPTGQVHAFEPNPVLQAALDQTLARNKAANVKLHRLALGSKDGTLELCVPPGNAGQGSFIYHRDHADATRFEVPVRRLSSVLEDEKVAAIKLVKIDVEGFEADVLLGAEEFFQRVRPAAILFEMNDRVSRESSHPPVIQVLERLGYAFLAVPRRLLRMGLRVYRPGDATGVAGHDVVALPAGAEFERLSRVLRVE